MSDSWRVFSLKLILAWLSAGALLMAGGDLYAKDTVGQITRLEVQPPRVDLSSKRSRVQLVVTAFDEQGRYRDVTQEASFTAESDQIVRIEDAVARGTGNGTTEITVRLGSIESRIPIVVSGQALPDPVRFHTETLAALTKQGCNAGSCHGSPQGKGGFALSLLAYDPRHDERSLIHGGLARRINVLDPEESLLLKKPMLRVNHVGGKRLRATDATYRILHDWIYEGAKSDSSSRLHCSKIVVFPSPNRVLSSPHLEQQLRVVAHFEGGNTRDVTHLATFGTSHKNIATVSPTGLVRGGERGQAAITVRYLQHLESIYFTVVHPIPGFEWKAEPERNYVDRLVNEKLRQLGFLPSPTCDDSTFLRRVYLDLTGLLPGAVEARALLEDQAPDKRERLIERLLETDAHANFWALKSADLMRVDPRYLPGNRAELFFDWIRDGYRKNLGFDRVARSILTSLGDATQVAPSNYFCTTENTQELTEMTSQVFIGSRLACAKCHNHPFEKWTQNDYYSIAAVFARVKRNDTMVELSKEGEVHHPSTRKVMKPWASSSDKSADRRIAFADWLVAKENPYFARVEVNRIWSHLFGRGLVDPVDDFRSSNPPSNVPLLNALADDFAKHGFDRRHIIRTLCLSQTYQRSAQSNPFNKGEDRLASHMVVRLLSAEQLQDAIGYVTASLPNALERQREARTVRREFEQKISKHERSDEIRMALQKPEGEKTGEELQLVQEQNLNAVHARLAELEDRQLFATQRPYPERSPFLLTFGQPERKSPCACERAAEPTLDQSLRMLNGKEVHHLLQQSMEKFAPQKSNDFLEELYLTAYARLPSKRERDLAIAYLEANTTNSVEAKKDLVWAILNSREFLFQH